ncbi:MAG: T9SS type A sorting domain-containing protein [Sediminibacterium sp.]|nr:T9SS type A sorting domain-containing protein [Sediminibacterium sp.]
MKNISQLLKLCLLLVLFSLNTARGQENCDADYELGMITPNGNYIIAQANPASSVHIIYLPPLCNPNYLSIADNWPTSNTVTIISGYGTNTVLTNSVIPSGGYFQFNIPVNTTGSVQSYTVHYYAYQIVNPEDPGQSCKSFIFDWLPQPPVNFTVVPTPLCAGGQICFNSPTPTLTNNVHYDYFQITPPLNPAFFNNAVPNWYNSNNYNPTFANVFTSTCVPTSFFGSAGVYTIGLAAFYTTPLLPNTMGCYNTQVQTFTINPAPGVVSISSSTASTCQGSAVSLTANVNPAITSVTWQPGNLSGLVVSVTPTTTTTYTLYASTAAGCTVSTVATIQTLDCCNPNLSGQRSLSSCTLVPIGTPGALTWSNYFNTVVSATNSAIEVPASGNITANLFIRGDLQINAPVTFNSSEIVIDHAGSITQNAVVTIDRSYLHGCNRNWKGIGSTAALNITNSVIEDAKDAVSSPAGGTHPGLTLVNVFFNKNLNGLNFQAKVFTSFQLRECVFTCRAIAPALYNYTSGALWRTTSNFSNTGLTQFGQATLKGSSVLGITSTQRSQTGMLGLGVSMSNTATGLIVGTSNPVAGSAYSNLFDLLPVGTAMFYSQIDYYHNWFQNIRNVAAFQDQYGSVSAAIYQEGCRSLVGTYPAIIGSVYGNTVSSSDYGVRAITNGSLNVSHSRFEGVLTGVFISKWYGTASNNYANTINNNSFNNCVIDVNGFDNKKINLSINSNVGTWTATGRQPSTYNVALAELSKNAACKVEVLNNLFSGKNKCGVYANTYMGLTVESNTITMATPLSNQFAGDIWLDNTDDSKIRYNQLSYAAGNTSNWFTFGIFTASGLNNLYCSNSTQGATTCMKFQGAGIHKLYSNVLSPNSANPSQLGIFLDQNANIGDVNYITASSATVCAENQFGTFAYADTYCKANSQGQRIDYSGPANGTNPFYPAVNLIDIFPSAQFNPTPNSSTGLVNCGSSQSPQSGSSETQSALRAVAPTVNTSNANAVFAPVTVEVAEKVAYDLIKQKNLDPAKIDGGVQFVNTQNNQANGKFYKSDSLIADYTKTKSAQTLQLAKNQNTQADVLNDVDDHQKTYNTIYLAYLDNTISEAQKATLKTLAQLCPFTDGNSVYQSRALLKAYDTTDYRNACETALPALPQSGNRLLTTSPANVNEAAAKGTEVFPNPASTELNITTDLTGAEFTLSNVLGQVISVTKLTPLTKLDVSNLKNGTYLYTITKDKAILKSDKLIITK